MAKIFLDTNYFIDAIHRKPEQDITEHLKNHLVFVSNLSVHIYCYIFKIKLPNPLILAQVKKFKMVEFSKIILDRALEGPTSDFEDNVQLHSAAEEECDIFLTSDKKLLDMKFFGKTRMLKPEDLPKN